MLVNCNWYSIEVCFYMKYIFDGCPKCPVLIYDNCIHKQWSKNYSFNCIAKYCESCSSTIRVEYAISNWYSQNVSGSLNYILFQLLINQDAFSVRSGKQILQRNLKRSSRPEHQIFVNIFSSKFHNLIVFILRSWITFLRAKLQWFLLFQFSAPFTINFVSDYFV